MTERIEQMLAKMREAGLTHALVQKPQNMRYLTGYDMVLGVTGSILSPLEC